MQKTSLDALRSLDKRPIKELVYDFIVRCGVTGATDEEIEQTLRLKHQTASARRRDLVKAGRAVDSGRKRPTSSGCKAIVWVTTGGPSMATQLPPPPKLPGNVVAGAPRPQPEAPPKPTLRQTQKGCAAVLVAAFLETIDKAPYRLLWHTDLKTCFGEAAAQVSDPTSFEKVDAQWGAVLERLKTALDAQPHKGQSCKFGMSIDYLSRATGRSIRATFAIPSGVDLSLFLGLPPPVGAWHLQRGEYDMGGNFKGDQLPHIDWYGDDIPF